MKLCRCPVGCFFDRLPAMRGGQKCVRDAQTKSVNFGRMCTISVDKSNAMFYYESVEKGNSFQCAQKRGAPVETLCRRRKRKVHNDMAETKATAATTAATTTATATTQTNTLIDFLRGIAIFLMLWGYCIQFCSGGQFDHYDNVMFKTIYAFHMPFFMLISGYLFYYSSCRRGLTSLVEHRAKSMLYPILMCSILNFLLTNGVVFLIRRKELGELSLGGLWFLWSVLAVSVVAALAVKVTKRPALQGLLLTAGIVAVAVFPCREKNVFMYPYFVIGYLYSRNEERLKKFLPYFGAAGLAGFIVMRFFYRKEHYIYVSGIFGGETLTDSLKIDLFRWGIGLCGSVAAVWLFSLLYQLLKGRFCAGVERLGKDSLAVYALSTSLLSYWMEIISRRVLPILGIQWTDHIWVYNLVVTPAVAVAYSVGLLALIQCMKKCKVYRLVFGR